MKLYTPDGSELLDITAISAHPHGLLIEGRIMGAMPMKAVLRPGDLRNGLRFLRPRLLLALIGMLFKR